MLLAAPTCLTQTPAPWRPGSLETYAKYFPSGEMTASLTVPVTGSRVTFIDWNRGRGRPRAL